MAADCLNCGCPAPAGRADCPICGAVLPVPAEPFPAAAHAGQFAPLAVLALVLFALVVLTLLAH